MSEIILGWDTGEEAPRVGFTQPPPRPSGSGQLVADGSDSHLLAIAPTGKGKSRCLAIPNLLHWPGPAMVLDVKGEITAVTARYRREVLGQQVVVLDPWGITEQEAGTLNPLDAIDRGADLSDEAYLLASLVAPRMTSREPYWGERGEALIAGLLAGMVSDARKEATLGAISTLLGGNDPTYALAVWLDTTPGLHPFAKQQISAFLHLAEVTRSGVFSTACSQLRIFAGERIRKATERSSFDLTAVTRGDPLTVYLVVPPANLVSHAGVIRLWFASLMSLVTKRRTRPALSTLFVLDEMAQLGPMPQIQTAITLSRSYGMRCMMLLQSYSQLRQLYPADHQTLLENCGSVVTFGHTSRTMSVELAGMLGDVTAEALRGMRGVDAAVRTGDDDTRILRRLDYLSDRLFSGRAEANPFFGNGLSLHSR